jgi:phosphatidylinositol kinase/protein kinase (PI-3  family)
MENVKTMSPMTKVKTFSEKILPKYPPVFRYFFLESFLDAKEWFQKRLVYTRSVATSSIVGFMLGLGDRHCHNILLDNETAEVLHIDLGIAFDQGKLLSFPELIPFRLTREVIDGMGLTKVDGVFKRSCEETLKLLRERKELLLMILDVFKYDPLYNW